MNARRVVWRLDLDYAPWDTPDAERWGHGEPAMALRLLDFARHSGVEYHFFMSNRALRAFPRLAESTLNEGHALDWLMKRPERIAEARELFSKVGHRFVGVATSRDLAPPAEDLRFGCGPQPREAAYPWFVPEVDDLRDALRQGTSWRAWLDATESALRGDAPLVIVPMRPQVLARVDPRLQALTALAALGRAPTTLRAEVA